jgi:hypothetical protein
MMKLLKLTLVGESAVPVYVNPDHIVSIVPFPKHTAVATTAVASSGESKKYNVLERPDDIVAMLSSAPELGSPRRHGHGNQRDWPFGFWPRRPQHSTSQEPDRKSVA